MPEPAPTSQPINPVRMTSPSEAQRQPDQRKPINLQWTTPEFLPFLKLLMDIHETLKRIESKIK